MRRKVIGILHLGLSLLGEKMESLLGQKEAEIERLRGQLEDERRDLDAARAELACLREQTTPRIYKEGDRPKLPEMVLYRSKKIWAHLHRDCLLLGDYWLPMPPPPETK